MKTQKVVMVLLIIAIVLSAINIVLGLGVDISSYDFGCGGAQQAGGSDAGAINVQILPVGGSP